MEDILSPGMNIVYNGITLSTTTQFTIAYPNIQPSKYYKFLLQSKNCGQYSSGVYLTVASGSVPATISAAPTVKSFDSSTAMTVQWIAPSSNGGFAVTSYKVYINNSPTYSVSPAYNY